MHLVTYDAIVQRQLGPELPVMLFKGVFSNPQSLREEWHSATAGTLWTAQGLAVGLPLFPLRGSEQPV